MYLDDTLTEDELREAAAEQRLIHEEHARRLPDLESLRQRVIAAWDTDPVEMLRLYAEYGDAYERVHGFRPSIAM